MTDPFALHALTCLPCHEAGSTEGMCALGARLYDGTCRVHGLALVTFCPACRGAVGGARKSKRKTISSAANGLKGGRPKGGTRDE